MKKKVFSVNGSESFLFKSRCKFCQTGARFVYFILNKSVSENTLYKMKDYQENSVSQSRADDFYTEHSVKNRMFQPAFLFDPISIGLRKLIAPNMRYQQNDDMFTTIVECGCGRTEWASKYSVRKHIIGRKCRYDIKVKDISSLYHIVI